MLSRKERFMASIAMAMVVTVTMPMMMPRVVRIERQFVGAHRVPRDAQAFMDFGKEVHGDRGCCFVGIVAAISPSRMRMMRGRAGRRPPRG